MGAYGFGVDRLLVLVNCLLDGTSSSTLYALGFGGFDALE